MFRENGMQKLASWGLFDKLSKYEDCDYMADCYTMTLESNVLFIFQEVYQNFLCVNLFNISVWKSSIDFGRFVSYASINVTFKKRRL